MKKLLSLALVAFLATASVNAASYPQEKCKKECCKNCDDKCKEQCKGEKCGGEKCAHKCETKKSCCKKG